MKTFNGRFTVLLFFCFISISIFSQTTDSLSGTKTYRLHRFTPDYQFLLLNLSGDDGQTQKIYNTDKKELIDWDDFPRDQYDGHLTYNLYERHDGHQYQTYLSTIKNTGKELTNKYDIASHKPIISVPKKEFIRVLNDGSFLCRKEGKYGRSGQVYILRMDGKAKKLSHKFPSKFKPPSEMDISYDGKYGAFKRFYWKKSEHFQAFEIQDMTTGNVLDFTPITDEKIEKIAYVTDNLILYESYEFYRSCYKLADWKGNEKYKLDLSRMEGGSPNRVLNLFIIDNILYVIQQNGFQIGQEGGIITRIVAFDYNTGAKIQSKEFTNAIDIVPVKDNEFMVLYRDYNEHLDDNYDVNLYEGIGEGIAVEYIDSAFELVEFKYLQNSIRKASRKRWQPEYPRWVTGIRKYQVVEHDGYYKMVTQKELFGFRLSDGKYIANKNAKNIVKLANHIDPNLFLCDCINKYCHSGYVQNMVKPAKSFDTKFVDYVKTSSGITYKKTTTFYASDDSPYYYETKCKKCNGDGFHVCKDKVSK